MAYWGKTMPKASRTNRSFCLKLSDCGSLALKISHNYYHRYQLQLYAGSYKFSFCDFVIATDRDIFVQRIGREQRWVEEQIPKLESFYDSFSLNRLVK